MRIPIITISFAFMLVMNLSNLDAMHWPEWPAGFAVGFVFAWLFVRGDKLVRAIVFPLGFILLLAAAYGFTSYQELHLRAIFNGMSGGFILCFISMALLLWPRSAVHLANLAAFDGYQRASAWFLDRSPDQYKSKYLGRFNGE